MIDKALKSALQWWDISGVDMPNPPKTKKGAKPAKPVRPASAASVAPSANAGDKPASQNPQNIALKEDRAAKIAQAKSLAKSAKTLEALQGLISQFDAGPLSDGARQSVFARGNPQSDLMIIGEAPSREDDMSGQPFSGTQGVLLGKMMRAIGLEPDQYYVTNTVFWHPSNNRQASQSDVELCKAFTLRHIELFAPKSVLLMGNIALEGLTGKSGIMKERGQWAEIKTTEQTVTALPVFHPSLLLAQPALKRDMWRDLLAWRDRFV